MIQAMMKNTSQTRSKITVKIHAPILDALNARTDAACLRRDALINRTLEVELPRIVVEIPYRNSPRARRYIEARLKTLFASGDEPRQISLSLEPKVATLLESVCDDLNLPRETLLNRMLMLLGSTGDFIDQHFYNFTPRPLSPAEFEANWQEVDLTPWKYPLTDFTASWKSGRLHDVRTLASDMTKLDEASSDYDLALAPLGRIASIASDPFRWYRRMLQIRCQQDFEMLQSSLNPPSVEPMETNRYMYTPFGMPFEEDEMEGLNCYVDDNWLAAQQTAMQINSSKPNDQSVSVEARRPAKKARSKK